MKKLLFLLLITLTILPLASSLTLYPSASPSTSYDYVFNLTDNSDCSSVILSATYTITTNGNGFGYVDVPLEAIGDQIPTYLCEYRALTGDPVSLRKVHNFTEIIFKSVRTKSIITETINSSDWTNVTITESQISDLDHFTNADETDSKAYNGTLAYNSSLAVYDAYLLSNYSNNSQHFQSYTPTALYDYYKGLLDSIFAPIDEPLSLHLNGDNSPTATIDWDGQDLINVDNLNATTLTVGNANIEDTYFRLDGATPMQGNTNSTGYNSTYDNVFTNLIGTWNGSSDYMKNNTDGGYVIKAIEVNASTGYFSWLGNLANKITTIFAVTIHADVLNSTGTIYSNQTCYNSDCSAKIYHNGTGIVITS